MRALVVLKRYQKIRYGWGGGSGLFSVDIRLLRAYHRLTVYLHKKPTDTQNRQNKYGIFSVHVLLFQVNTYSVFFVH
jgi:hypothetical protein